MMRKVFVTGCLSGVILIGAATAPAYALPAPQQCGQGQATSTPGKSASSPGAPFNAPGPNPNCPAGGKGGLAYNAAGAPSQYDQACFHTAQNGTGTPISTAAPSSTTPATSASSSSTPNSSTPPATPHTTHKK